MARKSLPVFYNLRHLSIVRRILREVLESRSLNDALAALVLEGESKRSRKSSPEIERQLGEELTPDASRSTLWNVYSSFNEQTGLDLFEKTVGVPTRIRDDKVDVTKQAIDLIEQIERLVVSLHNLRRGRVETIRIGMYPSVANYLMPTIVRLLLQPRKAADYHYHVEVRLLDDPEALEAIRSGRIDVALLNWFRKYQSSDVVGEPLAYDMADKGLIFRKDTKGPRDCIGGSNEDLVDWDNRQNAKRSELEGILERKLLLLLSTNSSGGFAASEHFERLVSSKFMRARPHNILFLPTYRHIMSFVKRNVGVGIGPDPRMQGRRRKGTGSTPVVSADDRIGFIPIEKVIPPSELESSHKGSYGIFMRKGWDAPDAVSPAVRDLISLIKSICSGPPAHGDDPEHPWNRLTDEDRTILIHEKGRLKHNLVY